MIHISIKLLKSSAYTSNKTILIHPENKLLNSNISINNVSLNLIYFILLANKHSIFNLFSEKRTGSKAAKISGCNNSVTSDIAGFGSTTNTACEKQEVIKQ